MSGEVDFMIKGYAKLDFFGHEVYITSTHICTLIVIIVLILLGLAVRHRMKKARMVPDGLQNLAESYVETMDKIVSGNMGKTWRRYANYMLTLFMFILLCNISGVFGLRPPTADFGCTLSMALITFVVIQFHAFKHNGPIGYLKSMMDPLPLLLPINIIGELATPVSLSLRLFGNIMAGTVMMGLYYGLLPALVSVGFPAFLHVYLDLFSGAIQTYVFFFLSMVFIRNKLPE